MPVTNQVHLTQEITLHIGDPAVLITHPELHHYTRYPALKSILETHTLRATHYRQLNDTMEIDMLKEPLVEAVTVRFLKVLTNRQDNEPVMRAVAETGGIEPSSRIAAEGLVNSFYEVSLGRKDSFSFAEPYIVSFSTHGGLPYEARNGLLSQWRGYGDFCMVFDTAEFNRMLGLEFDSSYYIHANLLPVIYADGSQPVDALFPVLLDRLESYFASVIDRGEPISEDGFSPFMAGVSCYKHRGFGEECEIRAVMVPGSQQVADQVRAENPGVVLAPLKKIQTDERGRSFITLFQGLGLKLPVKRIIIGPSKQQEANARLAKELAGNTIPIHLSETPFIG